MTDLDSTFWSEALTRMTARVWTTMEMPLDGFPHYGDPEIGAWTTTPDAFWTGGFWVGELWLAAHYSGDNRFAEAAEEWLHRLAARVDSSSVFRGFLFYYGAVPGAELARSDPARDLAIRAARSLASTFNPTAGLLPLGAAAEEAHTVGDDESNIDGLIASPLLLWAAKESGDAELRRIALSHAARNAELCVPADRSVIQSASFDPATGKVTRRYTPKGYAEDPVWTRAQAWAMLGYVLSARLAPDEPGLLAHAERTAGLVAREHPGRPGGVLGLQRAEDTRNQARYLRHRDRRRGALEAGCAPPRSRAGGTLCRRGAPNGAGAGPGPSDAGLGRGSSSRRNPR
jgi:unsaturated chondroitin disaccharide hydrolase